MEKIKQGYKQTDIGVIPEDWEVKPIGKTLKIKHGKDQKKVLSNDGKYPILGTGGLMGYATNFLYSQESVLIGRKGTINKPMFMDKPFWTVDTLFYSEIKKGYLPKFIYYKFQMIDWYAYNEASGVPSLNAKTIEKIDISTPNNITEQTAIATALSDTDALIAALDKKIAKKQQIKQGAMQQLLTGKKRLPGFSGEWVEKKLSQVALNIKTGKRNGEDNDLNGKYPFFVRSKNILRLNSYSFDGEAILIPGEGGIGTIFHYIYGKFDYHQRVYKISNFIDESDGRFIFYYLKYFFGSYALQNSVKATVDSLRLATFEEFMMII